MDKHTERYAVTERDPHAHQRVRERQRTLIDRLREFIETTAGRVTVVGLLIVALVVIYFSFKANFGYSDVVQASRNRIFVCSETGKSFTVELKAGMRTPVKSPYSGRKTGYEFDEVCNWTADGKVSDKATFVLMNGTFGKKGPTFCPECHRLVVRNNPPASAERKPPPTEEEYRQQKPMREAGER